ncbi:rRNA maturation RNase YbeY [Aequorivita xiaoshiensis]|uniref:Endoribonuclease YbeY n=1 Tax=Aequorivita xiaoshiensis TaxID=2874476 RepID=A0A9X1R2Q5_9FLAO|nr:rRNA maturation RNase YbeY [Aequorivita xiaoshiensis]MCG2429954.1 rRNA maturation RNase YbeY [Aequorivita xiaoshiensis]
MIEFNFETDFTLENETLLNEWISKIIASEGFEVGEVHYIFCDDEFLHKLNVEFLNHDTLTDVISFDYRMGNQINGEIFISIERVQDNAQDFNNSFEEELHRVMIHGILHFCGYKDKTDEEEALMRSKENEALSILNG